METKRVWLSVFLAVAAVAQDSPHITRWQGSAQIATNGTTFTIPVHLDLETRDSTVVGSLVDGPQRTTSTSGELSGQNLTLHFADYAVTKSPADNLLGTTLPIVDASRIRLRFSWRRKGPPSVLRQRFRISTARGSYPPRAPRESMPGGWSSGRMQGRFRLLSCVSTAIPARFMAATKTAASF
jgi:hypothetical protein